MLRKYLHITLWILVFMEGIVRIVDFYPAPIYKALVPGIVLFLFLLTLSRGETEVPFLGIFLFLALTSLISFHINNTGLQSAIYFFNYLLTPYLYFITILNEKDAKIIKMVKYSIIILFLIQIPASWVKYMMVGQREEYIGTISYTAGSLSTIIPMFVISYLFSHYLYKRDIKDIGLILLFVAFGLIGSKRAIIFFLPLIMVVLFFVYGRLKEASMKHLVRNFAVMIIVGTVIVYGMIKLSPGLTPEGEHGVTQNLNYVYEYSKEYTALDNPLAFQKSTYEFRRIEGLIYLLDYLSKKKPVTFLFGEGAGKLITADDTGEIPMVYHYNIRYGGRMGMIYIYLQIGLIGILLFFAILFKMFIYIIRNRKNNYHYLAFIGMLITVIIDTIIYSKVAITTFPIIGVLYTYYAFIYRDNEYDEKILEEA